MARRRPCRDSSRFRSFISDFAGVRENDEICSSLLSLGAVDLRAFDSLSLFLALFTHTHTQGKGDIQKKPGHYIRGTAAVHLMISQFRSTNLRSKPPWG